MPDSRAAQGAGASGRRAAAEPAVAAGRHGTRRVRLRKIDPLSVLKLSLIFYFCGLIILMLALLVFWAVLGTLGVIDTVQGLLDELRLELTIDGGVIARVVFVVGLINVVLWSGVNLFLALLYNLLADVVGGLTVTVSDE